MTNSAKIKSFIKNNKKILLFKPGSNIEDFIFSGLNFKDYENLIEINHEDELQFYKNSKFDYFFIHGNYLRKFDIEFFLKYNITVDIFCIDLLGEGYDIDTQLQVLIEPKLNKLNTKIKILIPFNHYNDLENEYPNYDFFKCEFGGPRIFCSRYNRSMIHGIYRQRYGIDGFHYYNPNDGYLNDNLNNVVFGYKWSDEVKPKIFTCLIGEPRPHRVYVYKNLYHKNLMNLGYISCTTHESYSIQFNLYGETFVKNFKLPSSKLNQDLFEGKFGLHAKLTKNSYIDVVMESQHNTLPFKTEKCVKPFYTLQFPLIMGHQNIVNDLRKMDFDMFDDLIDHSYDNVEILSRDENNREREDIIIKSDMITNEVLKLSNSDIHSLYIKNKERFLYNQQNLFNKTIIQNTLFQELGKFIFGNDIEVCEYDFDEMKKIIL